MVYKMETPDAALGGALEDVRAFCSVIELGTITAAARHLAQTKGGISRRLSRLEQRLGVRLLSRTPRSVSATEEGLAFYTKAHDALVLLDDALETAQQARAVPRGHLRVTAPNDIGLDVLPRLLQDFRTEHPQITVELILTDTILDLAANRIDLAFRATSGELPDMEYRAVPIMDLPIHLYAAPDYLAQSGTPDTPAALATHGMVVAREATASRSLALTGPRGKSMEVNIVPVVRTSDFASAHRLLLAGAGIGALPDIVADESLRTGRLTAVLPDWIVSRARLHAITVAGREAPARVRVFLDYMRDRLSSGIGERRQ